MALVYRQPKRVYPRMPKRLPLIEQHPLYTLRFDGVDDYVSVSDSPSLDFTGSFTVEFSAKFNRVDREQWLVSKGGGWNRKGFFSTIGYRLGNLRFGMGNGTTEVYADNGGFTTGQWYHIAMVYDKPTMKVYSNGTLLPNTNSNTFDYVNTYPVRIGESDGTSPLPLDGFIAYVRIYSRAMSQAEIQRNMYNPLSPIRDGLVLFLPMLEGSGTTVRDYSGLGNNGTLYGGVSWVELMKYEIPAGAGV